MSLRPRTPATAPPCGGVYPSCCASSVGCGGRLATVLATGLGRLELAPSMPSMPNMPTDSRIFPNQAFDEDVKTTYIQGRLVLAEFRSGAKEFYEGERGDEHMVRMELPNGTTRFFEGEYGAEREVRRELPDGTKWFYEGGKGAERMVRREFRKAHKEFYEGGKGAERMVRRTERRVIDVDAAAW